jgi:hypothetical protein
MFTLLQFHSHEFATESMNLHHMIWVVILNDSLFVNITCHWCLGLFALVMVGFPFSSMEKACN